MRKSLIAVALLLSVPAVADTMLVNRGVDAGPINRINCVGGVNCTRSGMTGTVGCSPASAGVPGCFADGGNQTVEINLTVLGDAGFGRTVYIDSTNHRLGIGTVTPDWDLDVDRNTSSAVDFPRIALQNANSGGLSSFAWINDVGFAVNNLYSSSYSGSNVANYYLWALGGLRGYLFAADNMSAIYSFRLGSTSAIGVEVFGINDGGVQVTGFAKVNNRKVPVMGLKADGGDTQQMLQNGDTVLIAGSKTITYPEAYSWPPDCYCGSVESTPMACNAEQATLTTTACTFLGNATDKIKWWCIGDRP